MLKKLFRYDFCDIGKSLGLVTLVVVILSALGCASSAILWSIDFAEKDMPVMLSSAIILLLGAVILVAFLCVLAYTVISVIFITKRYYTNLFTDEGYLTFTLPVKVSQIFNAKVLAGLSWSAIASIVSTGCFLSLVAFSTSPDYFRYLEGILKDIGRYWLQNEDWSLLEKIVCYGGYGLSAVIVLVYELLLIYFCITLGAAIVKKGKLPLGIGLYFGANTVCSTVVSFLTFFASIIVSAVGSTASGEEYALSFFWEVTLQLIVVLAVYTTVSVATYFLNRYLLKNKLNLP